MKGPMLILLGSLTGCIGDSSGRPPDPVPLVDSELQQRIDDAVASMQADTCFAQADTSSCQWDDYEIAPADFHMARSTGESILIIDSFGEGFFPELVRYRNRIRGIYQVGGDSVVPEPASAHLPKRLGDVLVSFAGPEFIPAQDLTPVGRAAGSRYGKLNLLFLGHGGAVFGYLAELVPEQPLVLLELEHLLDIPPAICQGISTSSLAAGTAHFSAVTASLRQIMTDNNVRFINASFGSTTPAMALEWQNSCPGVAVPANDQLRQVLHIYDPLYGLLLRSYGVLAAHAATNLGAAADFPFDQVNAQYPNQVRTGYISSLNSGLDELGRGTVNKVDQFPGNGSADVYLNWNCEGLNMCSDPHYQLSGAFGMFMANVSAMSSSYITPLGLARLINLRYANHGDEPMSNQLISLLKQELTPPLCGSDGAAPCVFQDPIPFHDLELYRLNYE